jgi:hypothetical protein
MFNVKWRKSMEKLNYLYYTCKTKNDLHHPWGIGIYLTSKLMFPSFLSYQIWSSLFTGNWKQLATSMNIWKWFWYLIHLCMIRNHLHSPWVNERVLLYEWVNQMLCVIHGQQNIISILLMVFFRSFFLKKIISHMSFIH